MTRKEHIEAVKVKLEEISPFDEPSSFIAAGDDDFKKAKPILSYIEQSIDEAASFCLKSLPASLLHADVEISEPTMQISSDGVGYFSVSTNIRFMRFHHPALARDITSIITSEDPLYLVQQNRYTRAKTQKPVAVLSSNADMRDLGEFVYADEVLYTNAELVGDILLTNGEVDGAGTLRIEPNTKVGQIEIYSFPQSLYSTVDKKSRLFFIPTDKTVGSDSDNPVRSPIESYITLRCATMVAQILNDSNSAQSLEQEYNKLLQTELK